MPPRRWRCMALVVLACACLGFGPPNLADGDIPRKRLMPHQLRAMRSLPAPTISATSAILVDVGTRQVLYARKERERRSAGSFVKIATALVALQRGRLDQELFVRESDLGVYSAARLVADERFTLRDMLYLLLVPSDNAAANTIARNMAGSVGAFVRLMNSLVAGYGVTDTHFANAHGLDEKDAYSTAFDMAIIAYQAMADPTFAEIVRTFRIEVQGRVLENTNTLLNSYPGIIGVKTGTTDEAGDCLLSMVRRNTGTALAVVMNAKDRFVDSRLLLDYYFANHAELAVDLPATPQNRYMDESGNYHTFGLREPFRVLISPWQLETVSCYRRIDTIKPNPAPNEQVGMLLIDVAGQRLAEVPLYAR